MFPSERKLTESGFEVTLFPLLGEYKSTFKFGTGTNVGQIVRFSVVVLDFFSFGKNF